MLQLCGRLILPLLFLLLKTRFPRRSMHVFRAFLTGLPTLEVIFPAFLPKEFRIGLNLRFANCSPGGFNLVLSARYSEFMEKVNGLFFPKTGTKKQEQFY